MFRSIRILLIAAATLFGATHPALAQTITVVPVNIQFAPGQSVATLTVMNQGDKEVGYQIRAFAWSQGDGDQQTPTDNLMVSPPMGKIPASASQIVRLVLRQPAQGRESTYRIVLDQIPGSADPGTVRFALRVSLPAFAAPAGRIAPRLDWNVERRGDGIDLIVHNDGTRHESLRNITLTTADGAKFTTEDNGSPYILPGATRRLRLTSENASMPAPGAELHLTANGDAMNIDQKVRVAAAK